MEVVGLTGNQITYTLRKQQQKNNILTSSRKNIHLVKLPVKKMKASNMAAELIVKKMILHTVEETLLYSCLSKQHMSNARFR